MYKLKSIVGVCVLIGWFTLAACGQKGNLVLPENDIAAQNRATLPQILNPAASAPAKASSAPKP